MAWRTVEHDEEVLIGLSLGEFIQEYLQASLLHPRQLHTEALPPRGFESRVQLSPLVSAFDDIRWTEPKRALASPMPLFKPESRLVEGHNL
jgi:hypothetical protein